MSFITPEIVVAGLALFGTMFGSVTGVLTAKQAHKLQDKFA